MSWLSEHRSESSRDGAAYITAVGPLVDDGFTARNVGGPLLLCPGPRKSRGASRPLLGGLGL